MEISIDVIREGVTTMVAQDIDKYIDEPDFRSESRELVREFIAAATKFAVESVDISKIITTDDIESCTQQLADNITNSFKVILGQYTLII